MTRVKNMNRKAEKATPAAAVATASVVSTRPFSSTTTTSGVKKNIPNNPKSHPKTLDIPRTPPSKKSLPATNSVGSKGDKRSAVVAAASQRMIGQSPSRGGTADNRSKERQQQQQNEQQRQNELQQQKSSSAIHPSQFANICREVAQIREEHVSIRKSLSEREGELSKTRVALRSIAQERDLLRNKVSELEHILKHSPEMYSQVATMLSSSGTSGSDSGSNKTSPKNPQVDFHNSPLSHPSAGLSSPHATLLRNSNECTFSVERANSITVSISSPLSRNIVQQQQTQKLISTTASSQLDMHPLSSSTSSGTTVMAESPRKFNPMHGNKMKAGSGAVSYAAGGVEEMRERNVPRSTLFSPPSPSPNINSQESHQANNNNKNLQQPQQQKQHSLNSNNIGHGKNNMNLTEKSNKNGYSQGEQPSVAPPMQCLEYRNGNRANENGNDMANGNNNNNQVKNIVGPTDEGGGRHQQHHHLSQSGMTGLDLMLLGPDCSTKIVEHLVHPMAIESSVREIQHTLVLKGVPLNGERLREVEIEIDRLHSRIDHLRSQNDVLTLNLEDAKSNADRLTVLLGKYESNNVALQMAFRYSDQMSDAYEVLVALLETEIGQMLTRLHASGHLHLICSSQQETSSLTSPANPTGNAMVVSTSRSVNNNNSNDNSPSDSVPPSATNGNNSPMDGEKHNHDKVDAKNGVNNNNDASYDETGALAANIYNTNEQKENNNKSEVNSETNTSTVVAVRKENNIHLQEEQQQVQRDKIISPTSMHLVEQAKKNRLAAERAARFLLSRFSPPTRAVQNMYAGDNRGANGNPSLYKACQSNSTTSIISSVTSNLSNVSGESGGSVSLSSPDEDDENGREGKRPSTIIRVAKDVTQVDIINGDNMVLRSSTAMSSSNNNSPTTTTSTTFRAPLSPNGNVSANVNGAAPCTSFITSLLPLLLGNKNERGNAASDAIEPGIRNLISSLKGERDAVKQTVMELESESLESLTPSPKPSSPYYINNRSNSATPTITASSPWSPAEARKLDLETAVLMQELMAMKEERAELRAQLFLLEKEKGSLRLRLRSHESQEEAYRARINYLKSEIMDCKSLHSISATDTLQHDNRNRNAVINSQQQQQQQQNNNGSNRNLETIINNNNNNQNVNWEREALLKKRIHELASTLERVTVSTHDRERQNQEMINELNRANGILMQTLDCAKKKYQNRIKKMEDQILYISERHASQLRLFGERMPGMAVSGTAAKYHV